MKSSGKWNKSDISEKPAIKQLRELDYECMESTTLDLERKIRQNVVLEDRLKEIILKRNPWIDEYNLKKTIRSVATVIVSSTIESNEHIHRDLISRPNSP